MMLALGNRDVIKGLDVNNFGGEREMEDMELEEGEAYSYHNRNTNDEYGDCIDPDVSLSYIDEKIQHVLGHFQKDFAGGVSAENLGTKFGDYGSFLENGERFPICDTPRLPPSSRFEDGSRNPVTPLSVPLMIKPGSAPVRSVSSSGKQPHAHDLVKQGGLPPLRAVEHVNSTEREETKSVKLPDSRMLKVRIKVGSDNLSKQKKAAIYCGLGLDVSPSTSIDYSPSESEGMMQKPKDVVFESPMNILQIMTSYPVHENLLLSPLGDDLICFTLREMLSEHIMNTSTAGPVSCHILANGSVPLRDKRTVLDRKVSDSKDKIDEVTDLKSIYGKTSHTGNSASSKKTMEMDTIECEEVVPKTLKLPLVSGLGRMVNLMRCTSNDAKKDETLNGPGKEGTPESPLNEDIGLSVKPKGYSGNLLQDRKAKVNGHPRKNGIDQGEMFIQSETHHTNTVEANNAKSAECHAAIPSDNLTSAPRKVKFPSRGKAKFPSRGKAKFKGDRNDESLGADASRESLSGSSSATKSNKSIQLESSRSNSGREDVKLKDYGKSRNRYKEFFGDFDGEEDNQDALEEVPADVVKDIIGAGKGLSSENAKIVKSISKKIVKSQKPTIIAPVGHISELGNKHDMEAATVAPAAPALMKEECGDKCDVDGAPVAPAVPLAPAAPVFIEDWVCCDKCQKWRLLPPGKNPDDLPDKWVCSMLDWLPGLNRCSVSEEETRGAIMASLQVPLPDFQKTEYVNCGVLGGDDATWQSEVKHTSLGPPPPSSRGKKKPGAKRMSFPNKDGPQFSDSEKKPVQSAKSRSLDDVKLIPLRNEADFEKPIKRESIGEKRVREEKAIENNYDGGNLRNSKSHKRRETDGNYVKSLKMKVKNEPRQHDNEEWRSDDDKTSRRVVEHSIGGVPALMGKNHELDEVAYMKTSKHDSAKRIQVSLKNLSGEGRVSLDGQSLDVGGSKERDVAAKKRKPNDPQEVLQRLDGSMGHRQGSGGVFARDNEKRKDKKQRMLKHGGKESSKIDKRGSEQIDKQHELDNQSSRWGINDVDSVQRKTRSPIPAAAASSSSKVCSSPKSKSGFQEMKGSPAESVSSSPIRSSKRDQHNLMPRNPMVKEEDSRFVEIVRPRKYPDGDVTALANHFWTGRQEESANAHYGSLGSSLVPNTDENVFSASTKAKVRHSLDACSHKGRKDSQESSSRDALGPIKTVDSDQCFNSRQSGDSHHDSESHSQKSGKGSSSRSRDRSRSSKHEGGRDKPNSSFYNSKEAVSLKEAGFKEGKAEIEENVHDDGKGNRSAVETGAKCGRVDQSLTNGQENKEEDSDALCGENSASRMDNNGKKFSTKHHYSKADQSAERRQSLPSSLPGMIDSSGTNKVNEAELIKRDAFEGDTSKFPGKSGGIDSTYRNCRQRPSMSNGNFSRENDARSPIRKDSSNQAANKVIKEGADLKHMADRFKNTDSSLERTVLYFQAVLKFLHGASLLESSKSDGSKHNGTTQSSTQVYASTAKLCEYCAYEYEKCKDMASAALAYKCMEVAHMKVVYSSSNTSGRDRVDLQKAFKINLAGESPSSSASDLDNVNNSAAMEKSPKGGSSPNVTESQCIIAQNREHLIRLLNFSQDVSNAMEASRKSHIAFTAASARTGDAYYMEGISCIRRALDFNFHDVQGLLRLVRLASEAIGQ